MRKSKKRLFLIDTNLFVSAIKKPHMKKRSLDLILEIINNEDIELVANKYLMREINKYSKIFESETVKHIVNGLKDKIKLLI